MESLIESLHISQIIMHVSKADENCCTCGHLTNSQTKPRMETEAKSDVDGNRKGFMFPFSATTALNNDNADVTQVKNTTNSGRSG